MSAGVTPSAEAAGRPRRWPWRRLGCLAFGLLLWLQVAAGALAREAALPGADATRMAVYGLPLLLLGLGVAFRSRIPLLLLFPASFAAVVLLAPPALEAGLRDAFRFALAAATLVAYAVWAASWLELPARVEDHGVVREPLRRGWGAWRQHRGTFAPRAVLLVALFLVLGGLLPFVPALSAAVTRSFSQHGSPESVEAGMVLCCLILFLAWCVLAYTLFVAPVAELETRVRQLETQLEAVLTRAPTARRKAAFLVTVAVSLALMLALLALRAP